MDVVSLCPLRTSSLLWQPRPSASALAVICKATYELRPGEARLAAEQDEPCEEERHWDDDPNKSLCWPSDRAPFKRRADVLLVGHAFAPNREPVSSLVARLAVGGVDKSIEVFGERFLAPDGTIRRGRPFATMRLRYEHAAGGPDTENPVGVRPDTTGVLPNLQAPGTLVRNAERIAPAGFGPIAWRWPGRIGKLGRHAATWSEMAWNKRPLPDDLDVSFFNAAPPDQQTDRIAADATITLENLNALHPRLRTSLPGIHPRAFVERADEGLDELPMVADTLWIDTDRSVCTLVWRGQLQLRRPLEEGNIYVLLEEPKKPLSWAEIKQRCRVPAPEAIASAARPGAKPSDGDTQKILARPRPRESRPGALRADPDLPFIQDLRGTPAIAEPRERKVEAPRDEVRATSRLESPSLAAPLPFVTPPAAPPPQPLQPVIAPPVLAPPVMASPVLAPPVMAPPPPAVPGVIAPPSPAVPPVIAPPAIPPPPPSHEALPSGVLAISNAAATPWTAARAADPESQRASVAPPAPAPAEIIELLWFDPAIPGRIREHDPFRELLELLAPKPPEIRYDDEAPPPEEPQDVKDRREVFSILVEAEPVGEGGLDDVLARAVGPMGAFRPPLALVAGDLQFPFDEMETLKATVAAVSPLAAGDKKLKEIVETVNELLKTPWLEGSSGIAESLTARLKEAFAQSGRLFPAGHLDAHTERRLLSQRHYQRRTVFGRTWLRALLTLAGAPAPIPTYLPDDLATVLPMFQRMKVRLVAEVHLQQDQYETHPQALRAAALARVAPGVKGAVKHPEAGRPSR